MRWNGLQSDNVEDRRGQSFGGPMMIGGGGLGAVAIIIISLLFGADPRQVMDQAGAGQQYQMTQRGGGAPPAGDQQAAFVSAVLKSTEVVWSGEFQQRGQTYQDP